MEENFAWFILGAALAMISFIYIERWKRINISNRVRKYSGFSGRSSKVYLLNKRNNKK